MLKTNVCILRMYAKVVAFTLLIDVTHLHLITLRKLIIYCCFDTLHSALWNIEYLTKKMKNAVSAASCLLTSNIRKFTSRLFSTKF